MACNTAEVVMIGSDGKRRSIGWIGISCRTASQWYVDLMKAGRVVVLADGLPSREAAAAWARDYLRAPYEPAQ
jgi:hypothetical protein